MWDILAKEPLVQVRFQTGEASDLQGLTICDQHLPSMVIFLAYEEGIPFPFRFSAQRLICKNHPSFSLQSTTPVVSGRLASLKARDYGVDVDHHVRR